MTMTRQQPMISLAAAGFVSLGLLCCTPVFGQQNQPDPQSPGNAQQTEEHPSGEQQSGPAEIPEFLKELDLSSEQESQIKQVLQQHNEKLFQTWKEFHKKHAEAVDMEAAWAYAVRDSLSEEDQRKFDQQRLQDREMSRHSQKSSQREGISERRREARERRHQDSDQKPGAAERAEERQAERRDRQREKLEQKEEKLQQRQEKLDAQQAGGQSQDEEELNFVVITIRSPERFIKGANQSTEQKQQCSEACQKYVEELTSVWQDLHRLHHELVQIEADRIQAVEEQLTDDQLAKLREDRQEPESREASTTSGERRTR